MSLNVVELLRFVLLTLVTTPPNYHWQQFLEQKLPAYVAPQQPHYQSIELQRIEEAGHVDARRPAQSLHVAGSEGKFSWRNTAAKWFIDCITVGAVLNTVAFLVLMGIMKARSVSAIWQSTVEVSAVPLCQH
jgi:hypothetical protein